MAINKKAAAKPSKNVKTAPVAKKAAAPQKAIAKPSKQTAKPAAKKAAPARQAAKALPAKKAAPVKTTTKSTAAKKTAAPQKATPTKTTATTNNQKTVNKKNIKPAPPAKKAPAAKKAEPAKKTAPAKKAAPIAKKAPAVAKPAAKPAAKAPAKPAPVAKKAAPAKPAPAPEVKKAPAPAAKKVPVKKVLTVKQLPVKAGPPAPRPMATPAARSTEKKPTVIIAHRRLENKAKEAKESTNTMIQYQPETYRSILDEPQQQQGPVYRYSDEDLQEFREIITSRLDAARKELNYLQGLITRKDEAGTEDTENRYMNMEDGSGAMEREQLAQLASRQIQFMNHLEKALVRIENKTYGICRVTGKLIDKARLRAVPHATLSIEAKKMLATKQN